MRLPSGEPEKILDAVYGLNFAVTDTGVFFIPSASQASIQFLRFADRKLVTSPAWADQCLRTECR